MNGINLLKNISAFLLELLLLVIFVPKTLFKIIKDPKWVHQHLTPEKKEEGTHPDFVSPVLLYLITALVPVVLFPAGKILVALTDFTDFTAELTSAETFTKGAIYMGIPLSVAFVLTVIKDQGLHRSSLEKHFFIQCYYLAPLLLVVQLRWVLEISCLSLGNLYLDSYILPVLIATIIWLLLVELFYIHKVLAMNIWKTVITVLISFGLIFVITDSVAFKVIPGDWFGNADLMGLILVVLISMFFGVAFLLAFLSWARKKRS